MRLSAIFGQQAAPAVSIPHKAVRDAVWSHPDIYTKNNDFNDWMFQRLGVSRLNHLRAKGWIFLTHPDKMLILEQGHTMEQPRGVSGSAGAFTTFYTTPGGKKGLAFMLREELPSLAHYQKKHHLLLAFDGFFVEEHNRFDLNRIIAGTFNWQGFLNGLRDVPLTPENGLVAMDYAAACLDQMRQGRRPTAMANLSDARHRVLGGLSPAP